MSEELEELANSNLENEDFENAITELHKKKDEKINSYILEGIIKDMIDVWKKCIEIKMKKKSERTEKVSEKILLKYASKTLLERAKFYKEMGY